MNDGGRQARSVASSSRQTATGRNLPAVEGAFGGDVDDAMRAKIDGAR
jgi:hypothetical protein